MLTNTNDLFRKASQTKQEMCHWNCSAAPQLCKEKPPLNSSTGSMRCHGIWTKTSWGHSNPEKYTGLNPAPAWITARKGQTGPGMRKHSGTRKILFFVYFYQPRTHMQIILLSHCTGFPGNLTSFLKLYAAQLIRTLILPWLWPWWCWWHRTRQDQKVWTDVSDPGRVSPVGCKVQSHQDHSLPSAQTRQCFHFTHLPADTFALSLGGDKALCFLVALEHLNTAHK